VQQALGAVDALQVAVDLGAQEALGEAVPGVAAQLTDITQVSGQSWGQTTFRVRRPVAGASSAIRPC
jgi:hypothetical protein